MLPPLDRRTTIKWMLAAAASVSSLSISVAGDAASREVSASQAGYGTDPDLTKAWTPGDPWPLTLSPAARTTAAALCDLIIPPDEQSPAASEVGVVDFLDEWVSAPYPQQRADRALVLPGLMWIEAESQRRYSLEFSQLSEPQRGAIADDICSVARATAGFQDAARFFARFRDLTAGGFYTTPVGMKDLGYVGNAPGETFAGPPESVLKKVGLV